MEPMKHPPARAVRRSRLQIAVLATAAMMGLVAPGCGSFGEAGDEYEYEGEIDSNGAALTTLEPTAATGTIDGQFQVDPSGSADYQIPILVPPGNKGVEPQLSIGYKSSGGNGVLGMGFGLSGLSTITRCPQTKAYDGQIGTMSSTTVKGDMNDRFCLDGQRLIVVNGKNNGQDGSEYRTELETRTRIFARGTCGNGPCRFEVIDKSGQRMDLGWTGNSKAYAADGVTPIVYGLSKLTDLHGNYMTVDYFVDSNQLYPQQILYTKNDAEPLLSLRKVAFTYEDRGDDDFVFTAGAKVMTAKRLSKISTYVDDGLPALVREYKLTYATSAATGRSLLDNIRECDGAGVCLPATTFDYNDAGSADYFEIKTPKATGPGGDDIFQYWLRYDHGAYIIPGDFNGDGKTDFLRQTHGGWDDDTSYSFEVYFSNGNGEFTMYEPAGSKYQDWLRHDVYIPFAGVGGSILHTGDFNGDGRTDFLRQEYGPTSFAGTDDNFNVYLSQGNGNFDIKRPTSATGPSGSDMFQHMLHFDNGANIIPGDYNGDGKTDFIRQEKGGWDDDTDWSFQVYFSNGNGSFNIAKPTGAVYQTNLRYDPGVNIIPGDYNGDGMTDFIRQEKGDLDNDTNLSFQVYFSKGDGNFDIVTSPNTDGWNPQEQNRYDPGCNIIPADFNGDGKTDYLRQERGDKAADASGTLQIHYSRGDGSFNVLNLSQGGFPGWKDVVTNLIPADYDGDGRSDFFKQEKNGADDDTAWSFQLALSRSGGLASILPGQNVAGDPYQDQLRYDPGVNIIPGDFNGDGRMDFIRQEKGGWDNDAVNSFNVYLSKGDKNIDSLKSVVNGLGGKVDIQYAPLTDSSVYTKGTGTPSGMLEVLNPTYVVKSYQETPSTGVVYDYDYHYTALRKTTDGRGSAGFASVERTAGDVVTTYEYNQAWPLTNTVKRTTIETGNTTIITDRTYEVVTHNYTSPSYTKRVLLSQETTTHIEGTSSYEMTKSFQYDGLGSLVVARDLGLTTTTVDDVVTCTTYKNDTGNWRLGYPASVRTGSSCTYTDASGFAEGSCTCTNELKRKHITYTPTWDVATVNEYDGGVAARQTSYTYDSVGNVLTKTTPGLTATSPVVETFGYDTSYKSFATTHGRSGDGLTESESFQVDPRFGVVTMKCDDNAKCIERTYDGIGREIATRVTSPSGTLKDAVKVVWGTDSSGHYREERTSENWTNGDSVYERSFFDGFGRIRRIFREAQASATTTEIVRTHNRDGNVLTESVPHPLGSSYASTVYQYDGLNRVAQITLPTGGVTKITYSIDLAGCNGCSMLTATTEGYGTSKARSYSRYSDIHDRVRKQVDPEGRATVFGFDVAGRKTTILTPTGTTTTTYDGLDRVVSMSSPERGTETYTYDPVSGWLESVSDGTETIDYTYDGLGRVEMKSTPTESVHYTYDEASAANGQGRLTHVEVIPTGSTEPSSTQSFTYTADGRVATSTLTVDDATYTVSSAYDPSGKLTAFTYPDGSVLTRTYHTSGDLAALTMGGVTYASYGTYNASNQPLAVTYGNGTSTTYAYDNGQRLTDLTTTGPGSATLLDYSYTWDIVNQVQSIADQRDGNRTQSFTYSAAGYLTQATSNMYGALSYGYDSAGNMTSKEGSSFSYQNNRVVSGTNFSASYDTRGNRISQTKGGVTKNFTFDRENHLREVLEGTVVKNVFDYDFKGERILKVDADGTKTIYVGPNFEVTKFTDGRRVETKYINGPSGRVAAVSTEIAAAPTAMIDFERLDATGKNIDKGSLAGLCAYAMNRLSVWRAHPDAPKGLAIALTIALIGAFVELFRSTRLPARLAAARDRVREIVWPEGTDYARRHPLFALAIPFVMMAFLSACSGKPVDLPEERSSATSAPQALTAGANGYGYPVAGSYWFHQNHVGSSSVVTDASGAEVARAEYKPYGEIIHSVSPGLDIFRSKFTGKEWDKDSELYFFEARSFDPFTGRFLSADTELAGGPGHFAAAYNPYAYANNNPIVFNDPSGHELITLTIILVAVIAGAYAGGAAANGSWNAASWNYKSWKTWTGIGVGGVVGGLTGGMAAYGGMAGGLAAVVVESTAMNGLKFLSPEGSNWKQFLIGTSIDIGIGVATLGAGAAWTRFRAGGVKVAQSTVKLTFREALDEFCKKPDLLSDLALAGLAKGGRIGFNFVKEESQKNHWFDGADKAKAASPVVHGALASASRFSATTASTLARSFADATLRAAGFDEMSGRLVSKGGKTASSKDGSDAFAFGRTVAVY